MPSDGPLLHTGDLAVLGADGVLCLAGRSDNVVKVRGQRVGLEEVESVLRAHPGINHAVVVLHGEGADARLSAYVEASGDVEEDRLLRRCAELLPDHAVPGRVVRQEELPRLPGGKIDRRAAAALLEPATAVSGADLAGSDPRTALVLEEVAAVVGTPVHPGDTLRAINLNSLRIAQLCRRLLDRTDAPVRIVDLFRCVTVGDITRLLDDDGDSAASPAGQAHQERARGGFAALAARGRRQP
jgi:hypothetical protein